MITKTSELRKGDFILWWSGETSGWIQWFFTRRGKRYYDPNKRDGKISHNSPVYSVVGETAKDIDVASTVRLSDLTLDSKSIKFIYRLKDVPQEIIDEATEYIWQRYKNKPYAFLQWQTYPSRWLFEILYKYKILYFAFLIGWFWHFLHGFKDVRQWGTIFPKNVVCSEATTHNLLSWKICPTMSKRGDRRFDKLYNRLQEWSANKFHSTDSLVIYTGFPDIFELIYEGE